MRTRVTGARKAWRASCSDCPWTYRNPSPDKVQTEARYHSHTLWLGPRPYPPDVEIVGGSDPISVGVWLNEGDVMAYRPLVG